MKTKGGHKNRGETTYKSNLLGIRNELSFIGPDKHDMLICIYILNSKFVNKGVATLSRIFFEYSQSVQYRRVRKAMMK